MRSIFRFSFVPQRMVARTSLFTTTTSQSHLHTVVMIRHGESLWNVENKFTGWCDVPLTPNGEADARDAGELLLSRGLKFDVAFTSNLERAWRTCAIILSSSAQSHIENVRSWRLNERHYGILQGHNKDCNTLAAAFGDEQLMEWRKSYHKSPPGLGDKDALKKLGFDALKISTSQMNPRYLDPKIFNSEVRENSFDESDEVIDLPLASDFPKTESLKQCEMRAFGYWNEVIVPRLRKRERVLIVAHANTIRTLVKAVDGIDDEQIKYLKIPNGIPFVYTLDDNMKPVKEVRQSHELGFNAKYLVSGRNHPKMMEYELCVKKKMTALFEYLDQNGDGKITLDCLHNGLIRLKSRAPGEPVCEFELEEILRCIPSADDSGGVNLKAFLDAEETLLPKLTSLNLLK